MNLFQIKEPSILVHNLLLKVGRQPDCDTIRYPLRVSNHRIDDLIKSSLLDKKIIDVLEIIKGMIIFIDGEE